MKLLRILKEEYVKIKRAIRKEIFAIRIDYPKLNELEKWVQLNKINLIGSNMRANN